MYSEEIIDKFKTQGFHCVGISKVKKMNQLAPKGHRPCDYLPQAQTMITYAYPLNKACVINLPQTRDSYILEFKTINSKIEKVAQLISRYLENKGYLSLPFPAAGSKKDRIHLKADISHKHAAVLTGLGYIGKNNLLLTSKFGSRVRLGTIITEAKLQETIGENNSNNLKNLCHSCNKCIKACPSGALKNIADYSPKTGVEIDKQKCFHYMFVKLKGRRCGLCIACCPHS